MSLKVKFSRQNIFVILAVACVGQAFGEEYYFDPSLLQGTAYGQGMASVNGPDTPAGEYLVDVIVNGTLIKSGVKIRFSPVNGGQRTEPCLPLSLMQAAQVKSLPDNALQNSCRPLRDWVSRGEWQFDSATLQFRLTLPMSELMHRPRGYIPPSQWDSGALALFLRHNTNWTHTDNTSQHFRYHYLWSGINVGSNIGLWQLRHQGNLRYADSNQSGSAWHYNRVRTGYSGHSPQSTASWHLAITIPTPVYSAACHSMVLNSPRMSACGRRANAAMRRRCMAWRQAARGWSSNS